VSLLNEVNKALSANESFEEGLVLSHILDIVLEIENLVSAASSFEFS
jgi:hypothetical protein